MSASVVFVGVLVQADSTEGQIAAGRGSIGLPYSTTTAQQLNLAGAGCIGRAGNTSTSIDYSHENTRLDLVGLTNSVRT